MKIGILTSGGDCPGLNAVIRGVAKSAYQNVKDLTIYGIADGFSGLINGEWREMERFDFSNILTLGGTILGTSRTPYKLMRVIEEGGIDKVDAMKKNYKKLGLDCLVILGGNGTHKTASLLCDEGLNVIGLPKTIDNDIYGTDVTFGFHSAVDIGTECIDRLHSTAASHGRTMVVEIMGNKVGWLTLYSGIAGGADIILIPEIPFSMNKVCSAVEKRAKEGKSFSIIAVAEGAMDKEEAELKKKERAEKRAQAGELTVSARVMRELIKNAGVDARLCVPGHLQRGGSPSPYDRLLSTQFGAYAAMLLDKGIFGVSVALKNGIVGHNPLSEVAGKTKKVQPDHQLVVTAKDIGVSFGD